MYEKKIYTSDAKMTKISSLSLKCPITGLLSTCINNKNYLLVGEGYFLYLISDKLVIDKVQLFTASKVHVIKKVSENEFLILGGKSVAVIQITSVGDLQIKVKETLLDDWIWDCCTDGAFFYFLTAHNKVYKTNQNLGKSFIKYFHIISNLEVLHTLFIELSYFKKKTL